MNVNKCHGRRPEELSFLSIPSCNVESAILPLAYGGHFQLEIRQAFQSVRQPLRNLTSWRYSVVFRLKFSPYFHLSAQSPSQGKQCASLSGFGLQDRNTSHSTSLLIWLQSFCLYKQHDTIYSNICHQEKRNYRYVKFIFSICRRIT